MIAMTSPGNPAPEPMSTQVRAAGAQARSWAEFGEMPVPDLVQRAGRDQVDGLLPLAQQSRVGRQPRNCFT